MVSHNEFYRFLHYKGTNQKRLKKKHIKDAIKPEPIDQIWTSILFVLDIHQNQNLKVKVEENKNICFKYCFSTKKRLCKNLLGCANISWCLLRATKCSNDICVCLIVDLIEQRGQTTTSQMLEHLYQKKHFCLFLK